MSRFNDDGEDWDYGRYCLWEQAMARAITGKRGQAALSDLERALVALPEQRLCYSHLAKDGEVCAVGALVVANRTAAGEDRAAVMADLEERSEDYYNGSDDTARIGEQYGRMAYAMAWRIAELNDEDCRHLTPEQRYQHVLAWVRNAQLRDEVLRDS